MAMKRRPATAEEVQDYFDNTDLAAAQVVHQLVGRSIKRREEALGQRAAERAPRGSRKAPASTPAVPPAEPAVV